MSRSMKKERERGLAQTAAERLGATWNLGVDCEHPDFIVTEGAQQFGLEVSEIFTGRQGRDGSAMREEEAKTQRNIDDLRRQYEASTNTPLTVRLLGNMCAENIASIVPALIAEELSTKPIGHRVIVEAGNGLRAHVTRTLHANWVSMSHRVGWVDRDPIQRIVAAIQKKSRKLPRYIETAGPDIRLLIVADRRYNSGKLMLEEQAALELQGFQRVYFFSYPESIIVFDGAGNTG